MIAEQENTNLTPFIVGGGVIPSQYSVQWKDPPKTIRKVDCFGWYREKREGEQGFNASDG